MQKRPLVTTLIPTYRRPNLLARAIQSALVQTMPDLRVLVVDNASGDETPDVVAKIAAQDPRVKYVCQPENIGLTGNFNSAMQQVETPYFSLLCDDDLILPGFYEDALAGFEQYPKAMSSSGAILFLAESGAFCFKGYTAPDVEYFEPPAGLAQWTFNKRNLVTGNLFKREIVSEVGPLTGDFLADLEFELMIAARFPYVRSPKPFAVVVDHEANDTKRFDSDVEQWSSAIGRIGKRLSNVTETNASLIADAMGQLKDETGYYLFQKGMLAVYAGDFVRAQSIADGLDVSFGSAKNVQILRRMIALCKTVTPAAMAYRGLVNARKRAKESRTRGMCVKVSGFLKSPRADFALP